jgi:pyruvate,water dikinase
VQRLVRARLSGVLFTRNPDAAGGATLLAEYCYGPGDALVSGRVNPGRIVLGRDGTASRRAVPEQEADGAVPSDAQLGQLVRAGLALEEAFGGPQDVEWAIGFDERLYLVQSRPITVAVKGAEPTGGRIQVWSNANVNENYPEPISPLLYSIAAEGYYHYFRNLGLAFGFAPERVWAMEPALRHIIGVHGARMYYNLTNIHAVLRQAPCGGLLAGFFNSFVGASQSPPPARHERPVRRGPLSRLIELGRIAFQTARHFCFLTRRVEAFERTVADFAARTDPDALEGRPLAELLDDFRAFRTIRCHRWLNASLADAAAMISYGALKRLLRREFPEADRSALHNTLLKGTDVVSGVPVARLWELAQRVRAEPALADLFTTPDSREILAALRTRPDLAGFRDDFEAFLRDWGFRRSGELMLTVPSFQERPEELIDLLKAYAARGGESPADLLRRQAAERAAETARVLSLLRRRKQVPLLPWPNKATLARTLLRWAQRSIALRERARLKQALLYSRLRRIALAIGRELTGRGTLEGGDDVFFLTASEIEDLLAGSAMFAHQVGDLVRLRRAGHAALAATVPPDSFELAEGSYWAGQPLSPCPLVTLSGGQPLSLSGVGACGGRVTGRAALLRDVSEFALLAGGDVLVTRQTDPGWGPVFPLIRGLVIERGGMLSHGAILAREYGIPAVVGVADATRRIAAGQTLAVDGDRGIVEVLA